MAHIIGIDLGTTNSCAAVILDGKPVVIPSSEGASTTPSVVCFNDDGSCTIGEPAKRCAILNPKRTIYSVKRFMGEAYISMRKEIDLLPYRVACGDNQTPKFDGGTKWVTPIDVSAELLRKLKHNAEIFLGEDVKEAVITVPAGFNDSQRQATKEAGELAGLKVRRIINEPTAATMAYGYNTLAYEFNKRGEGVNVAVLHFGGGTFDISILNIGNNVCEVISTNGNTHLGGDDFDQKIMNWLADEFQSDKHIDLRKDSMAMQRLKEAAEKAKIELSSSIETDINLPCITVADGVPQHLVMKLTRAKFEMMCDDLVNAIAEPCRKALQDAGKNNNDIRDIILVGGSTRIPAIREKVKEVFGKKPRTGINPDEVVAMGAAIQGGVLTGEVKDALLIDVTPLSYGIETQGGVMTKLIDANTSIPSKKSRVFSTTVDNQYEVEIHVLQGEHYMAKDNKSIGRFRLTGIPPVPKGVPQIEVIFDIDANGILNVSAIDKVSGKTKRIRIEASSTLTEAEINHIKEKEALQHRKSVPQTKQNTGKDAFGDSTNQTKQTTQQPTHPPQSDTSKSKKKNNDSEVVQTVIILVIAIIIVSLLI